MRLVYLSFFLFLSAISSAQLTPQQCIDSTANGKKLPDFIMTDVAGDTIHFYDLKESIIVFDIWATWCGPCRQQAPIFDSLRQVFKSDSIRFISVSIDKAHFKWKRYVNTETSVNSEKDHFYVGESKEHLMFLLCHYYVNKDRQKEITTGIPQYVIIGRNHEIIERDAPQPQSGKLDDVIKNLIKKYEN